MRLKNDDFTYSPNIPPRVSRHRQALALIRPAHGPSSNQLAAAPIYEEYVTIAGQEAKARLTQRMQSPSWATIPDWKKVGIINDTITETRRLAARRLFAAHPELRGERTRLRLEKYQR
jgi:hypothetical protein